MVSVANNDSQSGLNRSGISDVRLPLRQNRDMTEVVANVAAPVVLISAGAAGIGRVMAESFLARKYRVHVCDSDPAAIAALLQASPDISATKADISNVAQVEQVFEDLDNLYGRLDVLVNNAGIAGPTAHVEDIEPAEWDRTIAVDLNGHFYCTRQAIPLLKQSRGSIISIASNAALMGCPGRAPYAASKWGIIGLTKTLAMELGPHGVRVNAICPASVEGQRLNGVIERDAQSRGQAVDAIRDVYLRQSSLRTFIQPEDVASLALFLASDRASRISGQAIALDGHTETLANWLD
jgi:NAD(P)-dependent dehydrogenase (short-subunit alcohol dehydrogenase family)